MGRVFLVRHAQASFLEPDYDKLSTTGEAQARILGEYWARHKIVFDRVCTGPRVRHRDTEKGVRETYAKNGLNFPEAVVLDEFDEFQGDIVLEKSLPHLVQANSLIRDLEAAVRSANSPPQRRRNFQRLFETVITKWVSGELTVEGVESWDAFMARVNRGLTQFLATAGKSETCAIFTSGGPVAVSVHRALRLSPQVTLRVAWMPRNCSYSEFLFSADRFTLSTFNSFQHLEDPALLTYR
ncbi:MAG TPA: histidine phosphatase family protein [Candidatus Acidoferrum sp.]|nr:histidine phosphatase family protein [Candidatus Acidoferrum sp.]